MITMMIIMMITMMLRLRLSCFTWRLASWSGRLVITFSDRPRVERLTRQPTSGGRVASLLEYR